MHVVDTQGPFGVRACAGLSKAWRKALAAPVRHASQLLHVQMEHVSRIGMLVSDDLSCRPVQPRQAAYAGTPEHGVHGGAGYLQAPTDPVGTPASLMPQLADSPDEPGRGQPRAAKRPGTAVQQAWDPLFGVPAHVLRDRRTGYTELPGHFTLGPACLDLSDQIKPG